MYPFRPIASMRSLFRIRTTPIPLSSSPTRTYINLLRNSIKTPFKRTSFRFNSTSSTARNATHTPPPPKGKKPQGIRALMKEYGYPALAVYLALSMIDLPICYVLVHSMGQDKIQYYENKVKQTFGYGVSDDELKHQQDVQKIEARIDQDDNAIEQEQKATQDQSTLHYIMSQFSWTEFAIAYGLHKSLIFIRLPITAAITPGVVKLLRGWGFRIGTDKLSTTANLAKDLAKSGYKDITASSAKFGTKPGKRKWWWFF
ncbi:NAT2 [Candida margitis]|uniref:NAT2 n=1 Tax=Candida margitis TaxID=1775924 RepID=UPI0022267A7E|nr:NAT2 [Candida margitis]KAI5953848.1 NAT2 [Candida margitis]